MYIYRLKKAIGAWKSSCAGFWTTLVLIWSLLVTFKEKNCLTSSDPRRDKIFCHSFRHLIWKYIWHILFDVLFRHSFWHSIYSDVLFWHSIWRLFDILSGSFLAFILVFFLAFYLTCYSGILSGIYSDILSDMGTAGPQPRAPDLRGPEGTAAEVEVPLKSGARS